MTLKLPGSRSFYVKVSSIIFAGSMDKTAKLWTAPDLKLLGVFRGHKRGIWDVQFSPVDQVVATASADACIYIWSISDFSCVKVTISATVFVSNACNVNMF